MKPETYLHIRNSVRDWGYGDDIDWSEGVGPPADSSSFAREAVFVIANSGMHHVAAQAIFNAVMRALTDGQSASTVFRHPGKSGAMDSIWKDRDALFQAFIACGDADRRLAFCKTLPWIGEITKYHLAKNLGADVAKPDRWMDRVAAKFNTDPHSLCSRLSEATGDRVATVDVVLWRACAVGIYDPEAM